MLNLLKAAVHSPADPLGGGIRERKLRELLLYPPQLPLDRVVLVVLDSRGIKVRVVVVVLLNNAAKLRSPLFCFLKFQN